MFNHRRNVTLQQEDSRALWNLSIYIYIYIYHDIDVVSLKLAWVFFLVKNMIVVKQIKNYPM